ncbi:ABC-type multidrug transport system [Vibrio ponticus]|nr:ABC-type multidrug transport system [Vibrio ponticus]
MTENHNTISRSWLISQVKTHKSKLIAANAIAIVATLVSVPIPLLLPLMVDEVLLNQPVLGLT